MLDDAADRPQADLAGHLRIVALGHELVLVAFPERDVVVAAVGRDAHEGLRHEACEGAELPADLTADLAVGGEPVRGLVGVVEHEIQLELPGSVFMVALDHVEIHRPAVLHDLVDQGLQLRELVDVVAVRLRLTLDGRLAVGVDLQPHHLRFRAGPQVQSRVLGELRVDALEVAATVRGEERAALHLFLAPPEQCAPHAGGLRIPRQHVEGLGFWQSHELSSLGSVADVVAVTVGEQVRGGAVHELEAGAGDALPVGGGDALAHDAPGDRDELVVHVLHASLGDLPVHGLDRFGSPRLRQERLEIGGQRFPLVSGCTVTLRRCIVDAA